MGTKVPLFIIHGKNTEVRGIALANLGGTNTERTRTHTVSVSGKRVRGIVVASFHNGNDKDNVCVANNAMDGAAVEHAASTGNVANLTLCVTSKTDDTRMISYVVRKGGVNAADTVAASGNTNTTTCTKMVRHALFHTGGTRCKDTLFTNKATSVHSYIFSNGLTSLSCNRVRGPNCTAVLISSRNTAVYGYAIMGGGIHNATCDGMTNM